MREPPPERLALGHIEIDFRRRSVVISGRAVHLTPKEFDLFGYMAVHANRAISDRELLQAVWGPQFGAEHERLHVMVNQLRKKIEPDPSRPICLLTVSRVGYQLSVPR